VSSGVHLTDFVDRHDFYALLAGQLELLEPEGEPSARLSQRPRMPAKFHPAYLLLEVISKTAGPEESSRVMRAALRAYGAADRQVWVADSFRGLPPPDPQRFPADAKDRLSSRPQLAVSLEEVKANFQRYGMLDEHVRFLEGWFQDTLSDAPVERLAVLRIDGDMYQSTMEVLQSLYAKVAAGGYVIVDDYFQIDPFREDVDDFRRERGITEAIPDQPRVCSTKNIGVRISMYRGPELPSHRVTSGRSHPMNWASLW